MAQEKSKKVVSTATRDYRKVDGFGWIAYRKNGSIIITGLTKEQVDKAVAAEGRPAGKPAAKPETPKA